jgi:hypothetical protein
MVNSLDCYSYILIGKLTVFFESSGVHLAQHDRGLFHFLRSVFSVTLKGKVGSTLTKAVALRISLNIDGSPITSKTHTHPSHSQTSRLLTLLLTSLYTRLYLYVFQFPEIPSVCESCRFLSFSFMNIKCVGINLTKAAVLRVNLNLDGAPITSRTHTHQSHSPTSRLLTSSLSLGVPVPRDT